MPVDDGAAFNRIRDKLFGLMREKADQGDEGAKKFLRLEWAAICYAGHDISGKGEPPSECPICKGAKLKEEGPRTLR